MEKSIVKPVTLSSANDPEFPVESLLRLDIENYLDQLDHEVALTEGERQHLCDLLINDDAARTKKELSNKLPESGRVSPHLNDELIHNPKLTKRERAAVLQFQSCQTATGLISGEFALGNILVANGQITRPQLDSALRHQVQTRRRKNTCNPIMNDSTSQVIDCISRTW